MADLPRRCKTLPQTLAVHQHWDAEGTIVDHPVEQAVTIGRGGSGYARVALRGHLDHDAAQRLRIQLGVVLDTGARYVTVDLSEVSCCKGDQLLRADRARRAQLGGPSSVRTAGLAVADRQSSPHPICWAMTPRPARRAAPAPCSVATPTTW